MKKMTFLAALGIATCALAAPEKLGDLQLADQQSLVAAATKIGEFAGQPSIGTMAAMGLSGSSELAQFCGTNRVSVLLDGDPATISLDDLDEKASPLFEHDAAPLPPGTVARVSFTKTGAAMLCRMLDEGIKELGDECPVDKDQVAQVRAIFAALLGGEFTLAVGPSGVDVRCSLMIDPASPWAKVGEKTFAASDPLVQAGRAFLVSAYAADTGSGDFTAQWSKLSGFLASKGFKVDGLGYTQKGASAFGFKIDIPAIFAFAQSQEFHAAVEKIGNPGTFLEELRKALVHPIVVENPEQTVFVTLKGAESYDTASRRFAKILPEAASRKCCTKGVGSIYGFAKALAEQILAQPELKEVAPQFQPVLAQLPSVVDADLAYAGWKEGGALRGILRVSPAEIKGLVTAGMTFFAQMQGGAAGGDDDDDDDDD